MNTDLEKLLERACESLSRLPGDRLWEAAQRCEVPVPVSTRGSKPFKDVFPSPAELGRALAERTGEIRSAALALLADLDKDTAADVLGDVLRQDLTNEQDVYRSVTHVYRDLIGKVAPAKLAEAWLSGRLGMSEVPDAGVASVPIRRIIQTYRENRSIQLDEERLLQHPELQDGATVLAVLEDAQPTARSPLINRLLRRLGELKYAPAIGIIARALAGADSRSHAAAGQALLDIGTPEALGPLAALLDRPEGLPKTDVRLRPAVAAMVLVDPRTSFERLSPRFSPEALSTEPGRQLARSLLLGDAKLLKQDDRWLDLAVKLLPDRGLPARELLLQYKLPAVVEAMKRAGVDAAGGPPRTHPIPQKPRWLERYQAGEHRAVWDEIRALEDSIRDPAVLPEAQAVADEIMKRVRANLERIAAVLKGKKYKFRKAKPVAPPGPKTAEQLAQIEALLARPLPLSVRAFHSLVGEVSLLEKPDGGDGPWFEGYGRFEPLSPAPLKESLSALQKDDKEEKAYPPPLRRRHERLYFSDDPAFKEQPDEAGNDRPVYLELLGSDADAAIELPRKPSDAPVERVSFVEALRRYVAGGGFLWLPDDDETKKQREALNKGLIPF